MLLTSHNLAISFAQTELFSNINIELKQGQSVWLQGVNGAGKTTLLKLLAKLTKPSNGNVTHHGVATKTGAVIYLHQQPYLFSGSVLDNLEFGLKSLKMSSAQRRSACAEALELAQLSHLTNRSAQVLSGGERQRLALARAWVMQPKLLLLDEPTANLDPISLKLITHMVKQLQHQGCSIMVTSHQQTPLTELCQHRWLLEQKRLQCP
ncbi:energy-coupling factor ABC transporter ATP-binding protein [Ferrimonas lipolytica]|uniref:Energy-coupling factor ABC transporter ATP-binding protein n=1 Tax=Ferrimonas lipolytica TaxID=2724191 RepID=A0A6H1UFY3_9GAMM|nr:energy-coupling factor ABC transporter ATP-binding protein [Ferrimonas lipolytica]QIZ78015.1 energy-coupling factor ABC transporter ATP-binding protein [Ferrimonas lipolytica]